MFILRTTGLLQSLPLNAVYVSKYLQVIDDGMLNQHNLYHTSRYCCYRYMQRGDGGRFLLS